MRQRRTDSDEEVETQELQSTIAKFKEKKSSKTSSKTSTKHDQDDKEDKKSVAQLLSFDEELTTGDDGEIFRVKKSSQSRRLMKQKKSEKKKFQPEHQPQQVKSERNGNDHNNDNDVKRITDSTSDIQITVRDNIPRNKSQTSWILTGNEAAALHMEEEEEEEEDDEEDPLQKILKSGAIPDAAAIHAARKQRQAARDNKIKNQNFIPVKNKSASNNTAENSAEDDDDSGDDDDVRIKFTGIKSGKRPDIGNGGHEVADDEHGWEEQQIRKVMKGATFNNDSAAPSNLSTPRSEFSGYPNEGTLFQPVEEERISQHTVAPISYNLEGIKGRLKQRLASQHEVHRRHESDLDKVVDDLFANQNEIETLEDRIPQLAERHRFYQDLRGYVTDLVECFNEKVVNIKYLEDKLMKAKSDMTKKLMERRREDVRDQMVELTPNNVANPGGMVTAEEAARQRRSAERDGRRRRRQQFRAASHNLMKVQHFDGMSSDDEISSLDQANLAKSRSDVENQARTIMADVVEDFSTMDGVKSRFEAWKEEDPESYSDAFVSLCLPKIFSPLLRLQLLFWNPLIEHSNIESMEWYNTLAVYSLHRNEDLETFRSDQDRNLMTLVVEKVILVKMIGIVQTAYDPLSTTQTLKLTGTLNRLFDQYPTLTGESKQIRELLTAVRDRLKMSLDQDVYIPLGYHKQLLESSSSPHTKFVNRQFWSAYKLFKNIIGWHGILADKIIVDLAINSLLSRYLVLGLNITQDPNDALNKCRFIATVLPVEWIKSGLYKSELKRFVDFLTNLKVTAKQGPEYLKEVTQLQTFLGQ